MTLTEKQGASGQRGGPFPSLDLSRLTRPVQVGDPNTFSPEAVTVSSDTSINYNMPRNLGATQPGSSTPGLPGGQTRWLGGPLILTQQKKFGDSDSIWLI